MTVYVANVDSINDTFGQWITKTNYLVQAMSNVVVSTNSNTTVGSAAITGDFSSNSYYSNGIIHVGAASSNIVLTQNTIVLSNSPTANALISSLGMVINGSTAYTQNFVSMGNTTINTSYIEADNILVNQNLEIGSISISNNNNIYANTINTFSLSVYSNCTVGDSQANTFSNRYGINISNNPYGTYVVNSYMTATDLWIQNIHANTLNLTGNSFTFPSNTNFLGTNNYFGNGITTGGNSTIGGTLLTVTANTLFLGSNNNFLLNFNLFESNNVIAAGFVQSGNGVITNYLTLQGLANTYVKLVANSNAGNTTFKLPIADGSANQVMVTDGNGNLSFATPFTGNSTSDFVIRDITARSIGVGTSPSGISGDIRAAGNITAYYSSDARLKENVANIPDALSKLLQLNGVTFDWTEDFIQRHGGVDGIYLKKHNVGVIAQEVQSVLPDIVTTKDDGYLGVRYEKLTALLIEAVKELKAEVDSLKNGH